MDHRFYQSDMGNRNYKGSQPNFYGATNNTFDLQGIGGINTQKTNSFYNSNIRNDEPLGGTWVWRVGDRCMAKYWEDNMVSYQKIFQR